MEQPNGDFGDTIMRQFLFDAFRKPYFERLIACSDVQLSGIAEKSLKETKYHLKHSSEWVIRLGDGTEESHNRIQNSLNALWRYADELFFENQIDFSLKEEFNFPPLSEIKKEWIANVNQVMNEATLTIPENNWKFQGGREGLHSEHLGKILAEMQFMQRAYPNMEW